MIPYTIINKLTGEVVTAKDWTSSTGEGQDFLEFVLADDSTVRFNRPENQINEGSFENDGFTANYVNQIPVVETPTETA